MFVFEQKGSDSGSLFFDFIEISKIDKVGISFEKDEEILITMATKTLTTLIIIFIGIIFFPIAIGIFGGVFGLVAGVFGAVIGVIAGIFGAVFGAIGGLFGWIFGGWHFGFFHWNLPVIAIAILVIVLISRSRSK